MSDLNNLLDNSGAGWVVGSAVGINDTGLIAANAQFNDGSTHAVLQNRLQSRRACCLLESCLEFAARHVKAHTIIAGFIRWICKNPRLRSKSAGLRVAFNFLPIGCNQPWPGIFKSIQAPRKDHRFRNRRI